MKMQICIEFSFAFVPDCAQRILAPTAGRLYRHAFVMIFIISIDTVVAIFFAKVSNHNNL